MTTNERADPYPNFRFVVEIESVLTAGFSEVRGLSMRVAEPDAQPAAGTGDVPEWNGLLERDMTWGDAPAAGSASGRRADAPTLTLRRGVTDSSALWAWFRDWLEGTTEPADARVILLDSSGAPAQGWLCKHARPVRWTGPTLVATDSGVAMESFELAHDGIKKLNLNE